MKKTAVIFSLPVLLFLGLCLLLVGYVVYQKDQLHRRDADTLVAVATKLGYSADNQINFYTSRATFGAYDLIAVVFYSPDSLEQFSDKVNSLGFIQKYRFYGDQANILFLEFKVNYGPPKKIVTLNNHYLQADFGAGYPAPIVTNWVLKDAQGRIFDVYYAQPPSAQDVWLYDGKPLSGNIIVVVLDRQSVK